MRKLLALLLMVSSCSFAAVDQRDEVMRLYATSLLNGVYEVVGEGVQARIYFDTQDLYMDINGRAMSHARIDWIDGTENIVQVSHNLQTGRAITQMHRMAEGIVWTLEDGSTVGLLPVRALDMKDTMAMMCASKTGADLEEFKKAALASTGSKCSKP